MPTKQIPALPPLNEAPQDDDRLVLRDTSSGSDRSLRVDRLLERSDDRYAHRSNNLSDLNNAATARANLALGTAATANLTTSPNDTTAGRVLRAGDTGEQLLDMPTRYANPLAAMLLTGDPSGIVNDGVKTFGSLSGTNKWFGGVLAPNGKIYCVPSDSEQVLEIDGVSFGKNWWALSNYVNKF